jgi:Fe-Mn family superoxide dismutase
MNKREFIKLTSLAGVAALSGPLSSLAAPAAIKRSSGTDPKAPFQLPALAYGYDALEPHIDKLTMEIHHDKHHAAYVKNLNEAVAGTPFATYSLEEILHKITETKALVKEKTIKPSSVRTLKF